MSTTEQQILDLARSGQIAMCLIDLPGHIYQVNAAFLDLVGATQEDVQTGLSLHEFLNLPQRSPQDEQEPHELQVGQWTATFEQELLRRDGSRLPVLVEFSWLENASDRYVAKIVELIKYQALHAAGIIESSDDAIIGKDLNGIIISWNKGAERLYGYRAQAMKQAGLGFSLDGSQFNITPMLARLLRNAGCRDIGRRAHVIDISAGEEAHDGFYETMVSAALLARPFLIRMGVAAQDELDELSQHTLPQEMMADDFNALWFVLTVWGTTPTSR
ncbi:MAG: PAS domain S-box protein [Ktedonobacteraceae bacterium]